MSQTSVTFRPVTKPFLAKADQPLQADSLQDLDRLRREAEQIQMATTIEDDSEDSEDRMVRALQQMKPISSVEDNHITGSLSSDDDDSFVLDEVEDLELRQAIQASRQTFEQEHKRRQSEFEQATQRAAEQQRRVEKRLAQERAKKAHLLTPAMVTKTVKKAIDDTRQGDVDLGDEIIIFSGCPKDDQVRTTTTTKSLTKSVKSTKTPVKKAPVKKAPVKKAPVKKAPVKKAPVKKAPVKKASVKKAPVEKASVKKALVKKDPVKKAPASKTKAPIKKVAVTKTTTGGVVRKGPVTKTTVEDLVLTKLPSVIELHSV